METKASAAPVLITVCPQCQRMSPPLDEVGDTPHRVNIKHCSRCAQNSRMVRWTRICPPAYLNTEFARLPDQKHSLEAMAWQPGSEGLLLLGRTRKGKSRTAWEVAKRFVLCGTSVDHIDPIRLNRLVLSYGRDGESVELFERWCLIEILILDDVFKVKLTERVEEQIFLIVDERIQRGLPMIVTTNDTEDSLLSRLSADRGQALVARLTESCHSIVFGV